MKSGQNHSATVLSYALQQAGAPPMQGATVVIEGLPLLDRMDALRAYVFNNMGSPRQVRDPQVLTGEVGILCICSSQHTHVTLWNKDRIPDCDTTGKHMLQDATTIPGVTMQFFKMRVLQALAVITASPSHERVFACVDCETTGLKASTERIVEFAGRVVACDPGCTTYRIVRSFSVLVNPGQPIPRDAMAVHGITDEMVKNQPPIQEVLPRILDFIGGHPLLGHNINFDRRFIEEEAKRCGLPCSLSPKNVVDTLRLARLYGGYSSNSLDTLRIVFQISSEGAHRAMNDVDATIQVFIKLMGLLCADHYLRTPERVFWQMKRPIPSRRRVMSRPPTANPQRQSHHQQRSTEELNFFARRDMRRFQARAAPYRLFIGR